MDNNEQLMQEIAEKIKNKTATDEEVKKYMDHLKTLLEDLNNSL